MLHNLHLLVRQHAHGISQWVGGKQGMKQNETERNENGFLQMIIFVAQILAE
jgi:hypothetical protein